MARTRVIPGHITAHRLNALVLASTQNPMLQVMRRSTRQPVAFTLTPLRPQYSQDLSTELNHYGIELFQLVATGLVASSEYVVEDRTSGALLETTFRTLPRQIDSDGITIAVGSCYYDGFAKSAGYLATLRASHFSPPSFKLLVGDNLYLDIGPTKPGRDSGYSETTDRYLKYFWESHYAEVLSTYPTLTTWDDHEFWNNYPESQPWLSRSWLNSAHRPNYIRAGQECIRLFQQTLNPSSVVPGSGSFVFEVPPISFFVADTRTGRSLYDVQNRQMFSEQELQAFEGWSAQLKAPGIFVLGQPLWMERGGKTDYNPPDFDYQYARIWKAINNSPFDILVISGDVHHSRVMEILLANRVVYDFVTSPASHIPTVGSTVWGSYSSQDQGKVELADSIEVDAVVSGGVKPKRGRYLFGTDSKNTIAFLHFQLKGGTAIEVSGAFIDCDTQTVAPAVPARLPGWFSGSLNPKFQICQAIPLFTLR